MPLAFELALAVEFDKLELTFTLDCGTTICMTMADGVAKCWLKYWDVYAVFDNWMLLTYSLQPVVGPLDVPGAVIGPATWVFVEVVNTGAVRSAVLNVAEFVGTASSVVPVTGYAAETSVLPPFKLTLELPVPALTDATNDCFWTPFITYRLGHMLPVQVKVQVPAQVADV